MIYLDVDVAISELPVNALPLIDDTDFKSRETAIAYNESGMDLVWHFITAAGVYTQTAVTPTTAGVHDWAHKGEGKYVIELPTSGGTVNNDTEGVGWWEGVCDGVLPWRSVDYCFRAAGLNGLLIEDAFSATRGLAGTALPAAAADAAGGIPISDAGGLDLDTQLDAAISSRLASADITLSTGKVTVGTNDDKSGYSLSTAGILAIWHQLTSAVATASTMGKLLVDNIDAAISSRSSHSAPDLSNLDATVSSRSSHSANDVTGGTTVATAESNIRGADSDTLKTLSDAQDVAQADLDNPAQYKADVSNLDAAVSSRSSHSAADVWTSGTRTLTSFGTLVADIWNRLTSALTTVGSVGKLVADNLDATVSSRSSHSAPSVPTAADNADAVWDEAQADHVAAGSMGESLNNANAPTAAAIADAVWDEAAADHTAVGSMGEAMGAAGGVSINRAIQGTATYNPNTKELRALVFLESAGTIQNATALVASLHQEDGTEVYGDGDFTKAENNELMWLISKADGSNITQVKNYYLKVVFTVGGTGYTRHLAIGAQF